MINPEYVKYFYLRKFEEVKVRLATGDYYDLIMAAGLIRHLLLEDYPLVHKANRYIRLKLSFEVRVARPMPSFLKEADFFMPGLAPLADFPVKSIKESELLAMHCMTVSAQSFTVKDILESCAYARGGVHMHTPTERDSLLFEADAMSLGGQYRGQPAMQATMREIIEIILSGLQPLTDALLAEVKAARDKAADGT